MHGQRGVNRIFLTGAFCLFLFSCATAPKPLPEEVDKVVFDLSRTAVEVYGPGSKVCVEPTQYGYALTAHWPMGAENKVDAQQRLAFEKALSEAVAKINTPRDTRGGAMALKGFLVIYPDKAKGKEVVTKEERVLEYREGDILLTANTDLIGILVRLFTMSKYSHVAVIVKTDGQWQVVHAVPSGVECKPANMEVLDGRKERILIRRKNAPWMDSALQEAIKSKLREKEKKPYDLGFLLQIAFSNIPLIGPIFIHDKSPDRYVCTELVQIAYYEAVKNSKENQGRVKEVLFRRKHPEPPFPLPSSCWWPLHFITPKDFERTPKLVNVARKERGGSLEIWDLERPGPQEDHRNRQGNRTQRR